MHMSRQVVYIVEAGYTGYYYYYNTIEEALRENVKQLKRLLELLSRSELRAAIRDLKKLLDDYESFCPNCDESLVEEAKKLLRELKDRLEELESEEELEDA